MSSVEKVNEFREYITIGLERDQYDYVKQTIEKFEKYLGSEKDKEQSEWIAAKKAELARIAPVKHRNIMIAKQDVEVLVALEGLINKPIVEIKDVSWDLIGVRLSNRRVIGLTIYDSGLKELPSNFSQLNKLRVLSLFGNEFDKIH